MARRSKLLTPEIIQQAQLGLEILGKNAAIALKLKAIIAAQKHGLTAVAEVFGITKASLISWIKRLDKSLEQLNVQAGRGRKSLLNSDEEATVKTWLTQDSQLTIDHLKLRIEQDLGKVLGRTTVHRLIKKLSFSYITPRPRHYKQDLKTLEEAKKKSREDS
jgi:transposase